MYKQIKVPGLFGKRSRLKMVMFCDVCDTPIHYSSASDGRHLCEKCYKKLRGITDVSKAN